MIQISNLSKKYKNNSTYTLKNINVTFPDTGLIYLIGKSGSGKSTLVNLIALFDEEYEGQIIVNHKELKSFNEEEKTKYRFHEVSYVFQSYHAEDKETVKENLYRALDITSLSKKEKNERINKYLKAVDLFEKKNKIFKTLSGGEKKRTSLIRALIKDCPILLVDEPLSNLNSSLRKKITSILVAESKNRLVIIITHEKEEIEKYGSIYELINGELKRIKEERFPFKKVRKEEYQRITFSKRPFLRQLFSTLKAKREYLILTLFSLMIGLFAISFSLQLSSSVSLSIEKSMASYMDENCLVISKKDQSISDTKFKNPDYASLERIKRNHEDKIISISTFYTTSMNDIFHDNQALEINFNHKTLNIEQLSLNSFIEYHMVEEVITTSIYGKKEDLSDDELILSLKENELKALYVMLFDTNISLITEEVLEKMAKQMNSNIIQLRLLANKSEWGYYHDYSFRIVGISNSQNNFIIHSSPTFSNYFVTDVMHFEEIDDDKTIDEKKPWTLKKLEGYRLFPYRAGDFLKDFLLDEEAKNFTLKMMKNESYYVSDELETHNHVAVLIDYLPKIHLDEMTRFALDYPSLIENINYSSPVYTYTASGYISGFAKPFFFSKYKEKLNQIEDSSTYMDKDLGSFQGSLIDEIPGVIKADLLSSMNLETKFSFISLNNRDIKPYYGKTPTNFHEIGISKKMAEELFHSSTNALNKDLCTLTLDSTNKSNGKYKNHFTQGKVRITGIYDNDNIAIYQDSLFPLCYSFDYGVLQADEARIQQAVLKVDLNKFSTEKYESLIKRYGDYDGSFPMYMMIQEIKKTLSKLSKLFLSFSLFSLISAASLLSLSLYLIISKDKKEIAIMLSLGYSKKEIVYFYFIFALLIGIIGFILSLFLSLFAEKVMAKTLVDLLKEYVFNVEPFIISFLTSLLITGTIGFVLAYKTKKFSVKDAFDSIHR